MSHCETESEREKEEGRIKRAAYKIKQKYMKK